MTQPPAKPIPLRQRDWRAGATWKALPWRTIIINVVLIAALVYVFIPTARELPEIGKAIRTANPLWMAAAAGIAVLGFPAAALRCERVPRTVFPFCARRRFRSPAPSQARRPRRALARSR